MKKILSIAIALSFTTLPLAAKLMDGTVAWESALEFITTMDLEGFDNPTLDGVLTINSSTDSSKPVLYVYNVCGNSGAGSRFVIVSGENRTRRVLAYGDGALDLSDIPEGLQDLIDIYREQIECIISRPGDELMLYSGRPGSGDTGISVEPLLTTCWGQDAPYNALCPVYNGNRCSTGCVSTALSMVIHYHGFAQFVEPLPEYTTSQLGICLEPLQPVDFDWDNMLDEYLEGEYSQDEAMAVAQLMQYTGQASMMDYTTGSSSTLVGNIGKALKRFGYNSETMSRSEYDDDEWDSIIQEELLAERPVIYTANRGTPNSGHAFVLDGYDSALQMYHVNWGWNGKGNCHCVLDALSPASSNSVYNCNQTMIAGIMPADKMITVDCEDGLSFVEYTGYTQTKSFTVSGMNLTEDIVLKVTADNASYAVSPTRITPAEAAAGKEVQVFFAPATGGYSTAVISLSSTGSDTVDVGLNGHGIKSNGWIRVNKTSYDVSQTLGGLENGFSKRCFLSIEFSWRSTNGLDSGSGSGLVMMGGSDSGVSLNVAPRDINPDNLSLFHVFSYDLEGDSSYAVGPELIKLAADCVYSEVPNSFSLLNNSSADFNLLIMYDFATLGEHNATLTISHPDLRVKPVVIHLNGTAVWAEDADYAYGDINGDGTADVSDVTALIAFILGSDNGVIERAADVNRDQGIDVSDVTTLIGYILGE